MNNDLPIGASRPSLRPVVFWAATVAICLGVVLHLPMLVEAHHMGNRLVVMESDPAMLLGMALIVIGVPAAVDRALTPRAVRQSADAGTLYEAPDTTRLGLLGPAIIHRMGVACDQAGCPSIARLWSLVFDSDDARLMTGHQYFVDAGWR